MTQSIPLNKLTMSPRNVRKTNADEDIASLADSIASKGLLQNLVVSPADNGKSYEVDAGGRRLRALQLLAARKDLPKNWPVPVIVIGQENATEASLAENLQKVAMNPADEVEAFAAIVQAYADNGMSSEGERIANCARRFGVSERHVRQRLALAALAPEILAALRTGTVTVAAASAYASHPDPDEQLKVFKAHQKKPTGAYGRHEPRFIRDEFKGRFYPLDHRLVRFIGVEAYRQAGGRSATDLFFGDEDREMLLDTALVDKLASEKAAIEAPRLAQAEGWFDAAVAPSAGYEYNVAIDGFDRHYWGAGEVPAEQRGEAIVMYRIGEGGALEQQETWFAKTTPREDAPTERYRPETSEEREARIRRDAIFVRAFRAAAPAIAGTPLEGTVFWPPIDSYDSEVGEDFNDENLIVGQLLIKLPRSVIDAKLEEAGQRYDRELAELQEELEVLAAEEADGDSGEVGPEDLEGDDAGQNQPAPSHDAVNDTAVERIDAPMPEPA